MCQNDSDLPGYVDYASWLQITQPELYYQWWRRGIALDMPGWDKQRRELERAYLEYTFLFTKVHKKPDMNKIENWGKRDGSLR